MNTRVSAVDDLERKLGLTFAKRELLERALTHASVSEGAKSVGGKTQDNERLEFLGDRVLALIVVDRLMARFPEADEGELSKRLHVLVSREACAEIAEELGVGPALRLAAGETKAGGRQNKTILGDACEALIAAVYLDAGMEAARAAFGPLWDRRMDSMGSVDHFNPKSALQEWAATKNKPTPVYSVTDRTGPDHAPTFTVEVAVQGLAPSTGQGRSRQAAEKAAAHQMLQREGLL